MYAEFEEAFSRMKKAAGVSDVEEVVTRFSTQGKTSDILGDQMKKAENDVVQPLKFRANEIHSRLVFLRRCQYFAV